MNIKTLENAIIQELQDMPLEVMQEVLDFTKFIKQRLHATVTLPAKPSPGKKYLMTDLGGTEPNLIAPSRRRQEFSA